MSIDFGTKGQTGRLLHTLVIVALKHEHNSRVTQRHMFRKLSRARLLLGQVFIDLSLGSRRVPQLMSGVIRAALISATVVRSREGRPIGGPPGEEEHYVC